MKTGKNKLINIKFPFYMKQKSGYMIPVNYYLFSNIQNNHNMVLLFDHNTEQIQKQVNEEEDYQRIGTILTDSNFNIKEMTHNCKNLLRLSYEFLEYISYQNGAEVSIDDLFSSNSTELDLT